MRGTLSMNKRETNMKTIAGVKVTEKAHKRFMILNALIVMGINVYVMNNGGWTNAFQNTAQPQAQVTVPVK